MESIESGDTSKPYVRCNCGFEVNGFDGPTSEELLEAHLCSCRNDGTSRIEYVFSPFWGGLFVLVLVLLAALMGHLKW